MLYHSNKLMYDRGTKSLWHQFLGEPVVGPLGDSGVKLELIPVALTTWADWLALHPDTTVLSIETGVYPPSSYAPEDDRRSIYSATVIPRTPYFRSPNAPSFWPQKPKS